MSELQEEIVANEILNKMKEAMKADLARRFSSIESEDLYRVATYLDPRYMYKLFSSSFIIDQVKVTVVRLCEQLSTGNKRTAIEDEAPSKRWKTDDSV